MRLFYGGRAFKDPPLTTIFLLVFVLLSHCISVTGADNAAADTSTTAAGSTTTRGKLKCHSITNDFSIDEIISGCKTADRAETVDGQWFLLSHVGKDDLEDFLKTKTSFFPGIHIENRHDMDTLNISKLHYLSKIGRGGLHIVNTNIETILYLNETTPTEKILEISGIVTVRGNRKLKQTTIDSLRLLATAGGTQADIQSFGECFVRPLITDLKELDDCHYVTGDLRFANWPIGTTTNEIEWITGNVTIINTDLTRLPFAQTGKIKIDGNLEFQDNVGLCWINDENFKDYFDVKGKVRIRNTPCPYPPSAPINTTKKTKKSKQTTTAAPAATEEVTTTTKNSNNVFLVVPALSVFYLILL